LADITAALFYHAIVTSVAAINRLARQWQQARKACWFCAAMVICIRHMSSCAWRGESRKAGKIVVSIYVTEQFGPKEDFSNIRAI